MAGNGREKRNRSRKRGATGAARQRRSQRPSGRADAAMATQPPKGLPRNSDQLEGRNVVLEVLRRGRRAAHCLWIDERARPDDKLLEIEALAHEHGVRLVRVERQKLDERSATGVHNGVIAWADPLPEYTLSEVLDAVMSRDESPFIVLVDEVNYEHNLGAILRSAMGAGVHAVVVPVRRGKGLTPVVQRVAMGGAEEVVLIREGLSSALASLKRLGVRVIGADMGGESYWKVPMTGALAVVLGGEHKGLSPTLKKRCDAIVAVPLSSGLDSLNVSVTAGVLLFERVRQESIAAP